MTEARLVSIEDASERYWCHRANSAGENYGKEFFAARSGWRLLAFRLLAWERAGVPLTKGEIDPKALEKLKKGPHVLGTALVWSGPGTWESNPIPPELVDDGDDGQLGSNVWLAYAPLLWFTVSYGEERSPRFFNAVVLPPLGNPIAVNPLEFAKPECENLAALLNGFFNKDKLLDLKAAGQYDEEAEKTYRAQMELMGVIARKVWSGWQDRQDENCDQAKPLASDNYLPATTGLVDQDIFRGLRPGNHWGNVSDFPFFAGQAASLSVPSVPYGGTAEDMEAAWRVIRDLTEKTYPIFLVALVLWLKSTQNRTGLVPVSMSVSDVLTIRGTKPHINGGYKTEDKRAVARELMALSNVWVEVNHTIKNGRCTKRTRSQLMRLSIEEELDLFDNGTPYEFSIAPGDWILSALRPGGLELGLISEDLLKLDLGRDLFAFKLGAYLFFQFRIRAYYRNYDQPYFIGKLFASAGQVVSKKNPERNQEALEKALETLVAVGQIGSWKYLDVVPAGRGWLGRWLDQKIIINPPQEIVTIYAPIGKRDNGGQQSQPVLA